MRGEQGVYLEALAQMNVVYLNGSYIFNNVLFFAQKHRYI